MAWIPRQVCLIGAVLVLPIYGFHKSCHTVQQAGLGDGFYDLDPEQDGLDEFTVYCNTSSSPVSAILHHSRESATYVTDYEAAGSFFGEVVYDNGVTINQARSLVLTSSNCCYGLWMTCEHVSLEKNWWESYYGEQRQWETLGGTYCMQESGEQTCTCFYNAEAIVEDDGEPGNWVLFPLVAFHLGDTNEGFEWINFRLGPMVCYQDGYTRRTFVKQDGKRQTAGVTLADAIRSLIECAMACLANAFTCVAFNIQVGPAFVCELVSVPTDAYGAVMVNDEAWAHYSIAV